MKLPWTKCKKGKKVKKEELAVMPPQLTCSHTILFKVEARFLGRKAPNASFNGLESIQKPLSELFNACECDRILTKDLAREVMLVIFTSGILALPANPIDDPIWIKMQTFRGCGAVKANATQTGLEFLPIDQTTKSEYPAMFTVVTQRGGCVPLMDCYAFSCFDDTSANMLMTITQEAFNYKSDWAESSKPPQLDLITMQCSDCSCNATQQPFELVNPEMYKKPPLQGFFYSPSSEVIKSYDVGLETELIVNEEIEEQPCELETTVIMGREREEPVIEVVNLAHPQHQQYFTHAQNDTSINYDQFMNSGAHEVYSGNQNCGMNNAQVNFQSQPLFVAQNDNSFKSNDNVYHSDPSNYSSHQISLPTQQQTYPQQQMYQQQQTYQQQQAYPQQQQAYPQQQQQIYPQQQQTYPQQQQTYPQQQQTFQSEPLPLPTKPSQTQQINGVPMVRKVNIDDWMKN